MAHVNGLAGEWEILRKAWDKLDRLLNQDPTETKFTPQLYMNIYKRMFQACQDSHQREDMYQLYKQDLEKYLLDIINQRIRECSDRQEVVVREVVTQWNKYKVVVRWLGKFLQYLDRTYMAENDVPNLTNTAIISFRENCYATYKEDMKSVVLQLVEREREGETINRSVISTILEIFWRVGIDEQQFYKVDFEQHFLDSTQLYYRKKAVEWVQSNSIAEYLLIVDNCLMYEEERIEHCFDKESKRKFLEVVEEELLVRYEERLLSSDMCGVKAMFEEGKMEELRRLYTLFHRIGRGMDKIAHVFRMRLEQEGMEVVKEFETAAKQQKTKEKGQPSKDTGGQAEKKLIQAIAEMHVKYINWVFTCFNNTALFHTALKEAFQKIINRQFLGSSAAELMTNYCDNLLKKGSAEKLTDVEVDNHIEKLVKLLAYITEKDMFAEFYRKKLSRRLLYDKSLGDDSERNALLHLKQQCGAQFTLRMESMVNDFQLAKEKQLLFKEWLKDTQNDTAQIDINVTVLTRGSWPTYKTIDKSILPEAMLKGVDSFTQFYKNTAASRRLDWILFLGTCNIIAHFDKGKKELVMSTSQAALLMLFNQQDEISYNDIKQRMRFTDDDATRLLYSLVCAKYKILVKIDDKNGAGGSSSSSRESSNTICDTDVYKMNMKFTDKAHRIRIPLPALDEKRKVREGVLYDRHNATDSAIVRIMKSRKQLKHQQLIIETIQQLKSKFQPDTSFIKKRIEDLIDREFLERDPQDFSVYRYLA